MVEHENSHDKVHLMILILVQRQMQLEIPKTNHEILSKFVHLPHYFYVFLLAMLLLLHDVFWFMLVLLPFT